MKAVILAAGIGSRLRPHTENTPKCLLKVGGVPVLDRQLGILDEIGITEIAVVTGYRADMIVDHVRDRTIEIIHNSDYEQTNNAYSLWLAKDFVKSDPEGFVVFNSDLIFKPAMLRALLEHPAKDAIIVDDSAVDMTSDMVKVQLMDGRIHEMSKQLDASLASAEAVGPVLLSQRGGSLFMDHIEEAVASGNKTNWFFYTLSEFAKKYPFHAVKNPGHMWAEIDTVEDFEEAKWRADRGDF